MSVQFFHITSEPSHPTIRKPTMHDHPKFFCRHHPIAHILCPCIYHFKFCCSFATSISLLLHPLLDLLWISDRHVSLLHHSSLVVLVYCCLLSTGFYPSPKSFWSCTHVNSYQNYTLHINLHILLNILCKANLIIQESRKSI